MKKRKSTSSDTTPSDVIIISDRKKSLEKLSAAESALLQHVRCGHFPYNPTCQICIRGKLSTIRKSKVNPYKDSIKSFNQTLSFDLIGPIHDSIRHYRWCGVVIDHYSKLTECLPLKSKADAGNLLRYWVGRHGTPQNLRLDGGKEFEGNFLDEIIKYGIKYQKVEAYLHNRNGLVERSIRTLCDLTRCILFEADRVDFKSARFWCYGIVYASYIRNRLPNGSLNKQNPLSVAGLPGDINQIRIFGSEALILQPKEKRQKMARFDGYVDKGFFLGVDGTSNESIFLMPGSRHKTTKSINFRLIEKISGETQSGKSDVFKNVKSDVEYFPAIESIYNINPIEELESDILSSIHICPEEKEDIIQFLDDDESLYDVELVNGVKYQYTTKTLQIFQTAIEQEVKKHLYYQAFSRASDDDIKRFGFKPIPMRLVLTKKRSGTLKARLILLGYRGPKVECSSEKYAHTSSATTMRVAMGLLVENADWTCVAFDATSAFLQAKYEDLTIARLPPIIANIVGYSDAIICRGVNGLPKCPVFWEGHRNKILQNLRWEPNVRDPTLFTIPDLNILLIVFVDDFRMFGKKDIIVSQRQKIMDKIDCHIEPVTDDDIKLQFDFTGIDILLNKKPRSLLMSQSKYESELIKKHLGDGESKHFCPTPMTREGLASLTPYLRNQHVPEDETLLSEKRSSCGGLIHCQVHTRPDISFSLSKVASSKADAANKQCVKRMFRYLRKKRGLKYTPSLPNSDGQLQVSVVAYSDSDWASDPSTRRSVTGAAIFLGKNLIYWSSKAQAMTATSSCDAELVASGYTAKKMLEIIRLLQSIKLASVNINTKANVLRLDNVGAEMALKQKYPTARLKHLELKAFFVRDLVNMGLCSTNRVCSKENCADLFTKVFERPELERLLKLVGMVDLDDGNLVESEEGHAEPLSFLAVLAGLY